LAGKIGIKIPSHNSLTPSLLDELLKTVVTSRKIVDARRIRLRLQERSHIGIVSTGLSYLAYLGALEKVHGGYKPSRLGKRIGKSLAQEHQEEANVVWSELLRRHRLFGVFEGYFSSGSDRPFTVEDFSSYLKKKAHAAWDLSKTKSRVKRLCELFAEKGLIEYQNDHLSPISPERKKVDTLNVPLQTPQPEVLSSAAPTKHDERLFTVSANSWPIKMEIKIEISDKVQPEILQMILSFLKEMRKSQEGLKIDST